MSAGFCHGMLLTLLEGGGGRKPTICSAKYLIADHPPQEEFAMAADEMTIAMCLFSRMTRKKTEPNDKELQGWFHLVTTDDNQMSNTDSVDSLTVLSARYNTQNTAEKMN